MGVATPFPPYYAGLYNPPAIGLEAVLDGNRTEVLVVTPEQLMTILQDKAKNSPLLSDQIRRNLSQTTFGRYWNQTLAPNISQPAVVPISMVPNDLHLISRCMIALGVVGTKCYVKTTNGRQYLILKGYAGLRNALQGTRYAATNPQLVSLGVGKLGLQRVVKGGFLLSVVASAGIEIVDYVFNDQKTMTDLVGGVAIEVIKSGVVTAVAYGAGTLVGAATAVAVMPLVGVIAASLAAGYLVNSIDNRYQIKANVLKALNSFPADMEQGVFLLQRNAEQLLEAVRWEVARRLKNAGRSVDRALNDAVASAEKAMLDAVRQYVRDSVRKLLVPRIR